MSMVERAELAYEPISPRFGAELVDTVLLDLDDDGVESLPSDAPSEWMHHCGTTNTRGVCEDADAGGGDCRASRTIFSVPRPIRKPDDSVNRCLEGEGMGERWRKRKATEEKTVERNRAKKSTRESKAPPPNDISSSTRRKHAPTHPRRGGGAVTMSTRQTIHPPLTDTQARFPSFPLIMG